MTPRPERDMEIQGIHAAGPWDWSSAERARAGAGIKDGGEGDGSFLWLHQVGPGSCSTQIGWGEGGP